MEATIDNATPCQVESHLQDSSKSGTDAYCWPQKIRRLHHDIACFACVPLVQVGTWAVLILLRRWCSEASVC